MGQQKGVPFDFGMYFWDKVILYGEYKKQVRDKVIVYGVIQGVNFLMFK